ncbi:cation diffusion facilitator family transporter [Kribbella capetownensis]|uniref:Cation diffusion facilitator family transporter n=1 Tax=Kribbella capetownensis TaxID=1572659 RepID=A0A4R0K4B2_9ACTN|nr:cation diffusion facilitator family transporter [Kribbella capetownensis]
MLVAGAANLLVGAAKAVVGVISGSAALQAEAAHSVADTVTEVFLFIAARRGARGPDSRHPFGYGRETYLWAFLAALATFVAGAGFSIARGIETLFRGEPPDDTSMWVVYGVLAFAFVVEGGSLARGVREARHTAAALSLPPLDYLEDTTDTPVKAVIFEDTAALIGLVLAAVGVSLRHLTGQTAWDGLASIAIGALLVVTAATLARANLSLLVGQTVRPELQAALRGSLESLPGVVSVPVFVAVVIGPGSLMIAAKVHFESASTATDIERAADEAERRLRALSPGVRYVFLDPTPSVPEQAGPPGRTLATDDEEA